MLSRALGAARSPSHAVRRLQYNDAAKACCRNSPFPALLQRGYASSSGSQQPAHNAQDRAKRASWLFAAAALATAAVLSTRLWHKDDGVQCEALDDVGHVPDVSVLNPKVLDDPNVSMRTRMETYVKLLQRRIVETLGKEEPQAKFFIDSWLRKEGGEGISCVLQDGKTFEKAGVNISIVHGMLPPRAIAQMSADHGELVDKIGYKLGLRPGEGEVDVTGLPFYASGLSLVVHPRNPMAPTVHFNYRYFELTHPPTLKNGKPNPRYDAKNPEKPVTWWFGGGSDLTPIYLFDADATHFHNTLKAAADAHDRHFYPVWKAWCDTYFLIPHRGEARGVGGIFFDDLCLPGTSDKKDGGLTSSQTISLARGNASAKDLPETSSLPHNRETLFATIRAMGDAFIPAYLPILQVRKRMSYTPEDEAWQAIRRGRYVEFNLVYDRGTKFGLQTPGARIESILMSLPLRANWIYGQEISGQGKPEQEKRSLWEQQGAVQAEQARLMDVLRNPKEWATA